MRSARTAARVAPPSSEHGLTLKEWEREGWTYHAKGVWVRPAPDEDPVLTLLGSTNLSNRSAELDAELSFVMLSEHEGVRRQMGEEVRALWEHAVPWKGQERKVRLGTKALVGLVGSML
jgi:CDP-diacylglycerol--glycerol-3-phosphate 3-phosphatidyltransferase